jgi:glucose/mannose-6-phosphate isomerase
VHHNQVVTFAGRYGAAGGDATEDLFHDPLLDGGPGRERLALMLLRDTEELAPVVRRCQATLLLTEQYGITVEELAARGEHPLERLASLIAPLDFASVYLALLEGTDPTPIDPIVTLKKAAAL